MSDPIEKKSTRRRRALLAGAAILLGVYATAQTVSPSATLRTVDIVRTAGFVLLALVLAIRSTTAFSLIGRNAVLDDELTRANRASAARVGFWTTFAGAIVCLVVSMAVEPLAATQIMPILIGVGAVSAALRFATLEGRGGG